MLESSGHRDIIVLGASAGGVAAFRRLCRDLPADLPAAVFVVMHLSPGLPSLLPEMLQQVCPLEVLPASDGATIRRGTVYVARPDQHLLIDDGRVGLSRGPEESRHRPAVDVLFRSAALVYGRRVIGAVLTGALDDGTAGLRAIKRRGGVTIVQDPADAEFPDMPRNAIAGGAVDHALPLSAIGAKLVEVVGSAEAAVGHRSRDGRAAERARRAARGADPRAQRVDREP